MGDFLDALEPEPSSQESPGQDPDDDLTEPSSTEATGNMFLFGADAKSRATPGIVMPMAEEASIDAQEVPIISSSAKKTSRKTSRRNCSTPGCSKKAQVAPSGSSQEAGALPMEEGKRASAEDATSRATEEDYAGFMAHTPAAAAAAIGALSLRRFSYSPLSRVSRRSPGRVGDLISSLETPCLLVDLDALERNLRCLPESLHGSSNVAIRPHAKAHKSSAVGQMQVKYSNAVGLCCQKVGEAEAMFAGGVKDLLLSNEVFGHECYERMAVLAKQGAKVTLIFDSAETVQQAAEVAAAQGVHFEALVEVNVGQDRCGVDTVEEAVQLAKTIQSFAPSLEMVGIQAYHGAAQHIRSYAEKKKVIAGVAEKAESVKDALLKQGLKCDVVTGGGTGTYLLEAASGVFTEVQPGSYLFNDADYARNLGADGEFVKDWKQSLYVLTTVVSKNVKAAVPRAVVDAGTKAVSLDSGSPLVHTLVNGDKLPTPLEYHGGGDEHGILKPLQHALETKSVELPALGSKLLLVPGHCDPTTNMYDHLVAYRGNCVEHVWEIEARGPGN